MEITRMAYYETRRKFIGTEYRCGQCSFQLAATEKDGFQKMIAHYQQDHPDFKPTPGFGWASYFGQHEIWKTYQEEIFGPIWWLSQMKKYTGKYKNTVWAVDDKEYKITESATKVSVKTDLVGGAVTLTDRSWSYYIYKFETHDGFVYVPVAMQRMKQCAEDGTTCEEYIKSCLERVLSGALRWTDHPSHPRLIDRTNKEE
jgi:hypothetical protein